MNHPPDLAVMARALGAKRSGSGWIAPCPAHDDRNPSFSFTLGKDGRLLVHCHAGCSQAQVVDALRGRGLWPSALGHGTAFDQSSRQDERCDDDRAEKRKAVALSLWKRAAPAEGTFVQTYLQSRGILIPPPPALRFLPALRHPDGGLWPAMVAVICGGRSGCPMAVHRTFLAHDGTQKASVQPQKMMLGQCAGGVVRLAEPGDILMVGEGIETSLAAMQATGLPAWAALSTSGMRALLLPGTVREVIILADGDDPGEAAARQAAERWANEGRRVRIARPPKGKDFNDLLLGHAPNIKEGAP